MSERCRERKDTGKRGCREREYSLSRGGGDWYREMGGENELGNATLRNVNRVWV